MRYGIGSGVTKTFEPKKSVLNLANLSFICFQFECASEFICINILNTPNCVRAHIHTQTRDDIFHLVLLNLHTQPIQSLTFAPFNDTPVEFRYLELSKNEHNSTSSRRKKSRAKKHLIPFVLFGLVLVKCFYAVRRVCDTRQL